MAFELADLIIPAGLVFGGLLLGFLVEKLVLNTLGERLSGTRLNWGGRVVGAFRGVVTFWSGITGAYLALARLPLEPAVAGLLRNVLLAALILSGTLVAARIAGGLVGAYTATVENLPSSSLFATTARIVVIVVGVLVLLKSLGIAVSPIVAGLGLGGLAVSLALQDPLSNFLSGFQVLVSRQLAPGDFVSIGANQQGYVRDIKWRNTTIRTLDDDLLIVPNSSLIKDTIINHDRPTKETRVVVTLTVAPGSDLSRVEEATVDVARKVMEEVEGGVPEFRPRIRYNDEGVLGTEFRVIMRAREFTERYAVVHEFVKRLDERYRREGIEIPYPAAYGVYPDATGPDGRT